MRISATFLDYRGRPVQEDTLEHVFRVLCCKISVLSHRPRPPPYRRAQAAPAHIAPQVLPLRIGSQPVVLSERMYEEVSPSCVSANDLVNLLPPSLFHGLGWHTYHLPPTGVPVTGSAACHWYNVLPTSWLRILLAVGAGDVHKPRAVLGPEGGSAVKCWVDNNYRGKVVVDIAGNADAIGL
ncbi:hypothetical protein BC834DRAFT_1043663 [Gloeopeniophorella convolvens]|nr:hypothetical protein BC834DRAFT_1043663 [Gloeopeniophorella convolvens]